MLIPNLDFGGAQRSFCSLANTLSQEHSVTVAVFNTTMGLSFELKPELVDLEVPAGGNPVSKLYFFIKRYRTIARLKKYYKIDLTISYLEGANYLNSLTGTDRKILSVRGSKYFDDNIKGVVGWLRTKVFIPFLYKRADHIVALNNGIKTELIERFGIEHDKIKVIRNFYNATQIRFLSRQPLDKKFEFLLSTPYLVYAGRLASGKGLKSVLDSYILLRSLHPDLILVLVGDGPLKRELVEYVVKAGCKVFEQGRSQASEITDAKVLFLGYQENPYHFIEKAKMLLIASTSEGGPNILMESLICGTLVASTDCPYGPAEYLAPERTAGPVTKTTVADHGILLPLVNGSDYKSTLQQWCQVLSEYLEDEDKRNVVLDRARQWTNRQSPDLILESWKKIIC